MDRAEHKGGRRGRCTEGCRQSLGVALLRQQRQQQQQQRHVTGQPRETKSRGGKNQPREAKSRGGKNQPLVAKSRGAANQPREAKSRGGKNQPREAKSRGAQAATVARVNARMLAQQEALEQRVEQPVVASTGRLTRAPAWLAADR